MCDIPKPKMRGLLAARLRIHVPLAVLFSLSCATVFKVFVANPRRQRMKDYYIDFDPDVSFNYMRKYLQSGGGGDDDEDSAPL